MTRLPSTNNKQTNKHKTYIHTNNKQKHTNKQTNKNNNKQQTTNNKFTNKQTNKQTYQFKGLPTLKTEELQLLQIYVDDRKQ